MHLRKSIPCTKNHAFVYLNSFGKIAVPITFWTQATLDVIKIFGDCKLKHASLKFHKT